MEIENFIRQDTISILVNFNKKLKDESNSSYGYVKEERKKENMSVINYIKENTLKSEEEIYPILHLVKLKNSVYEVSILKLTNTEWKKVELSICLLLSSKVIICEHFFSELTSCEKEYFKRIFRNLIYKKKKSIILIEDDMNFVCETVKSFYLFYGSHQYKLIDNFYDMEIYQYVTMPYAVELILYLEGCGHSIDHEVTFEETLKAIYRGAK